MLIINNLNFNFQLISLWSTQRIFSVRQFGLNIFRPFWKFQMKLTNESLNVLFWKSNKNEWRAKGASMAHTHTFTMSAKGVGMAIVISTLRNVIKGALSVILLFTQPDVIYINSRACWRILVEKWRAKAN